MKISTRGRYSLRLLVDLAENSDGFVTLKEVSERQDISRKYLEQIIPFLNRSKLLISNKGHGGGYKLARPASEITVREVLESAEGSLAPVSCMEDDINQCDKCEICKTLPVYKGLYKVVTDFLGSITIQDVSDGKDIMHV